jgi:ubiquinone/menaquinone biosynthesis C-methylase UbiE
MSTTGNKEVLQRAVDRHDIDSSIFQGRYVNFQQGKYTDEFIYGRYQMFEEIDRILNSLPEDARVLDLGCGTGHFSSYIKSRGYSVTGLDPSTKMLGYARENFPDITFVEGYSNALPFEDNYFDLIISIEVLRYLDADIVFKSYQEIMRTLKPGGKTFITHVNGLATEGYYFFYHAKRILNKLRGKEYHNAYFTSVSKEEATLKEIGFKNISCIGRMFATIRTGYKFGKTVGKKYAQLMEIINNKQRFDKGFYRNLAGHLIVIAEK